jgi:Xaa-Pro aminopeptidase
MRPISDEKYEKLIQFLDENQLDILMLSDYEEGLNVNLQYLSGHPSDAFLLINSSGESVLGPWDINIAEKHSEVDEILDLSNFKYNWTLAIKHIIENKWNKKGAMIGVETFFPYGQIIKMKSLIPGIKFIKEPLKLTNFLAKLRATKSDFEIQQLKKAAEIGNTTINDIENFCKNASDKTEKDLSFLVRKKVEEYGADDIAFETLVANSNRAHEIHQYPSASTQRFALQGLALVDFGAKYGGYHSDITVPISFGELSQEQIKMRDLTIKIYETIIEMIEIGIPTWKLHETAQEMIKNAGFLMPYSLGHGLGLSVHDSPIITRKPTDDYSLKHWKEQTIQDGMVFTIEPGIIKKGIGGTRIENDVAVHNGKVEVITKSEPIIIPF